MSRKYARALPSLDDELSSVLSIYTVDKKDLPRIVSYLKSHHHLLSYLVCTHKRVSDLFYDTFVRIRLELTDGVLYVVVGTERDSDLDVRLDRLYDEWVSEAVSDIERVRFDVIQD